MDSGLGDRIRKLRLERKMTQREVVGDFITRNMLSQIESGIATPSIRTLEYLAGVFNVPVSSLIEGEESEQSRFERAKALLREEQYEACGELLEECERQHPDEARALRAKCLLGQARQALLAGAFKSARAQAEQALRLNEESVYFSRSLKADALLCMDETTNEGWDYFMEHRESLEDAYTSAHTALINAEMYLGQEDYEQAQIVLRSLLSGDYGDEAMLDLGRVYLLSGRAALGRERWDEALRLFEKAQACWQDKPEHELRPLLLECCEKCYLGKGEYREAHRMATLRLELMTGAAHIPEKESAPVIRRR